MLDETQRLKDRKRKLSGFDIKPLNEFITDKSKKEFGHICDQCGNKFRCQRSKNAIILKCNDFKVINYQNNNRNYNRKR